MTDTPTNPTESLTEEKSLWIIFRKHLKCQKTNKFNLWALSLSTIFFGFAILPNDMSGKDLRESLIGIIDLQLGLCASMLGFLIAGYTIFLSLVKPEHVRILCSVTVKETGLTYFKHVNFIFINVFIQYLAFLVALTAIRFISIPGNGFERFVLLHLEKETVHFHATLLYFLIGCWSIAILLYLKSFIFNIYTSSMTLYKLGFEPSEEVPQAATAEPGDDREPQK